jgi:hypothetical protein
VTFITLSCTGPCAEVEAVASGGDPPYMFAWEDGSTRATRQVCPTSSTSYRVKVTDTGSSGEFSRAPETTQVSLAASVIACPDASVSACGAGGSAPMPGHYVGSVYRPPDGGVLSPAALDGGQPTTAAITIDLATNGPTVTGSAYLLWSVGVIAIEASLDGTIHCSESGVLATWSNGEWGLPGTAPDGGKTVIQTGTATGHITVTPAGSPGTIAGDFDYVASSNAGTCQGTYTATLQP